MKKLTYLFLLIFFFPVFSPVNATEIVGNESYTVSWQGIPSSDNGNQYQVYFGQADGNKEGNAITNGLSDRSHEVRLNHLKPCTEYSWSLKTINNSRVWWSIRDRRFTTGGVCENVIKAQKQLVIPGNASATATWDTINGARHYNIYYKVCSDSKNTGAVQVPANSRSLTINYLNPNAKYCYRVAGMVGNKEVWLNEQTLTTNNKVLGTTNKVLGVNTTTNSRPKLQRISSTPKTDNDVLGITSNNQTTNWTEIKSHTGKMWKAPTNSVSGKVQWNDFGNKYPGAKQFEVYYKECSANQYQNAIVTPGNARNLTLNYLKSGVSYCYKVNVTMGNRSFSTEGTVTR